MGDDDECEGQCGRRAAQVLAQLVADQGGVLEAARAGELLTRFHPELWSSYRRERDRAAGRVTLRGARGGTLLGGLCEAHPALLTFEPVDERQEGQVRCAVALAEAASELAARTDAPAVVDAAAAELASKRLVSFALSKASQWTPPTPAGSPAPAPDVAASPIPACPECGQPEEAGWVPVPWLVRAVEKRLAAWVLLAPRADFARRADPGRFGLGAASADATAYAKERRRKGGVSWATLTAHFRPWAQAQAQLGEAAPWEWQERAPCAGQPQHHLGCSCSAHIRLRPAALAAAREEAARVAAEAAAAAELALRSAAAPPPLTTPTGTLPPTGAALLVVAGQCPRSRIGGTCALELMLAARAHGLGLRLRMVTPGLWVLLPPCESDTPSEASSAEQDFLQHEVTRLAALRRAPLRHLVGGTVGTSAQLQRWVAAAREDIGLPLPAERAWSLETEALTPQSQLALLPFQKSPRVVTAAVALAAALGGVHDECAEDRRRLVLLELAERAPADKEHTHEKHAHDGTQLVLAEAAMPTTVALWNSPWWRAWRERPHFFDGCLDLHLAVAAVNIGRLLATARARDAAAKAGKRYGELTARLRLVDPCLGSGSIAAAALVVGGFEAVVGVDVRPEWVAHSRANMQHAFGAALTTETLSSQDADNDGGVLRLGACVLSLRTHDSKDPFEESLWAASQQEAPASALEEPSVQTVVVMNPPWGRKVGDKGDAPAILQSQLEQFPRATFVVICPTIEGCLGQSGGAEGSTSWKCLHSIKVRWLARACTYIMFQQL
jgi:hypothetical protein